jgi:2-amino-1-hydroxyethylphosphonate dioxygenase (glycine-forming)
MQTSAEGTSREQAATERVVNEVVALLQHSGGDQYFGEAVTKLQHAEQCAWHAQQAGADEELILASLLHDVGHLIDTSLTIRDERVGVVNHDDVGRQWLLERGFSQRLATLVGGHVDAKRYLTATNPSYLERLTPASQETLRLQGGPMDESSAEAFAREPELRDMLRLRSWDEMAKDPKWQGPSLASYREMLVRHLSRQGS